MNNFFKYIAGAIMMVLSFVSPVSVTAQINTDQVMTIGRNALYFEDYLLSIQYFNQVIKVKPYLADPFFYRALAKLYLEDYVGAEADCTEAIDRNPFIVDAYQVRGIARQTLGKNKEAIADYARGLEQMPEHKTFLINKAVAEEEIKDYDNSEKTYARLIDLYPTFENGYLGRSQLRLAKGDTIGAMNDVDKCLSLSKNNATAYVMRADLLTKYKKDFAGALKDMDEAIKLEPRLSGYFINRAFLKYNLDDYFGAMADYDYAIDLDGENITARFNRGLLLSEVNDNNKAINDFSFVIGREPSNIMALYNRAELYARTGQYKKAIKDYDKVIEKVTDLPGLYYARSECKRRTGDMAGGEKDYNKFKVARDKMLSGKHKKHTSADAADTPTETEQETEEEVKGKFKQLLTIQNDNSIKPEYDRRNRGRIQDNRFKIDAEPQFVLSYYQEINELKTSSNYSRELVEINDLKILPFVLMLSSDEMKLYGDQIQKHFDSIVYYTSVISSGTARAVDYFARAMDFITVKNYSEAIADLDKAIELGDKFVLAYYARANAKYNLYKFEQMQTTNAVLTPEEAKAARMIKDRKLQNLLKEIIADYDMVLKLSPKMVYALYNKGCVYLELQDYTSALSAFTKSIQIKPDLGEAYYNRGLVYLRLGNKENGVNDLSRAGEFGITPSYSVLKRMMK